VTEEADGLQFCDKAVEVGRFQLLYQEVSIADVPQLTGYTDVTPEVRESDRYAVKVYELRFQAEGDTVVQYVFSELPAGPPYRAVLTLKNTDAGKTGRILMSVELPLLREFLPPKPLKAPDKDFLAEKATYTTLNQDGQLQAFYVGKLERLITQEKQTEDAIHILTFQEEEIETVITSWKCLVPDDAAFYLYTYYEKEGSYLYDNDPKMVKKIKKENAEEEGVTRYMADGLLLLEVPYNQYHEQKQDLLDKKDAAQADEEKMVSLVKSAVPVGAEVSDVVRSTDEAVPALKVSYVLPKESRYVKDGVLDEAAFYQNALVLFSLLTEVDVISIEVKAGEETYHLTYERKAAEQQFGNRDLREFTETEESFEDFIEEIPKSTPPPAIGTEDSGKTTGAKILFTDTVTVHSEQWVTHPETGDLVPVYPYAEKYGVTRYLNRPIVVTAYEQIVNGETRLWGTATCDGVVIASYPFPSREEMQRLISLIP